MYLKPNTRDEFEQEIYKPSQAKKGVGLCCNKPVILMFAFLPFP